MSCAINFRPSPRPCRNAGFHLRSRARRHRSRLVAQCASRAQAIRLYRGNRASGKAVAIVDGLPDDPGRTMNRLHLQITYSRALRSHLGHSAPQTVAAWTRARSFADDINDPVELPPSYSGSFNAVCAGAIANLELADATMSAANRRPASPVVAVVAIGPTGRRRFGGRLSTRG